MPDDVVGDRWRSQPREVIVQPDANAVLRSTADRLIGELIAQQSGAEPVHICVTGGGMGQALWPVLLGREAVESIDWAGVHVWFSDERFVPSGHPERNDKALLAVADALGLSAANVHCIPGPDRAPDVTAAAMQYAVELASWAPSDATIEAPDFFVSLLGIGPDGHVASLFPGDRTDESATVISVVDAPKPPPQRVSFTRATLRNCVQLWFVAVGEEKADAVGRALEGDDPVHTPAAGVSGRDITLWFIDEALAASL